MRSNNVFNVILFSSLVAGVAACAGPLDDSAIDEGTGGADGDAIEAGGSGEGLRAGFQKVAIDGDLVIADGPTSKLDPPSAEFDACDPGGGGGGAGPGGLLVSVNDTTDLTFQATTVGGNDDFKTFCGDSNTETAAPDVVYRLEVSDNCILGVTVTDSSSFNPALEIRRTSCATEVGGDSCANRATNVEEMRFEAAPGSTYWAIIDGSTLDDAGDVTEALAGQTRRALGTRQPPQTESEHDDRGDDAEARSGERRRPEERHRDGVLDGRRARHRRHREGRGAKRDSGRRQAVRDIGGAEQALRHRHDHEEGDEEADATVGDDRPGQHDGQHCSLGTHLFGHELGDGADRPAVVHQLAENGAEQEEREELGDEPGRRPHEGLRPVREERLA